MLRVALAQDRAGGDGQRGEEVDRAVTEVVARLALRLPQVHGEHRLRPLERLNLRLLVHANHDRVLGRVQVQPHNVTRLFHEQRGPSRVGTAPRREA